MAILGSRPGRSLTKLEITASVLMGLLFLATGESQEKLSAPSPNSSSAASHQQLPKLFTSVLADVKAECHLPVLLPSELPKPIADAEHAVVQNTSAGAYSIGLFYELEIGNAGFAANFSGESKPRYSASELGREIKLARGKRGYFRPVSCGGSCAPANLWWEANGVLYAVQLRLSASSSEKSQQDTITAVANSAILAGPR